MYRPDEECKKIIQRLNRLCEIKGVSSQAVAQEAGMSATTVRSLLSGKSAPQMNTLYRLCNALNVSIEDILIEGVMDDVSDGERVVDMSSFRAYQKLSGTERNLVALFRYLPEKKRKLMQLYMDMLIMLDTSKLSEHHK